MRIVLLGATGFVGMEVLKQALARNIQVTAIVRTPAKLASYQDKVTIVNGDYFDLTRNNPAEFEQYVLASDAVVSTIGPPENRRSSLSAQDFSATMTRLVDVVDKSSHQRLVHLTSAGTSYDGEVVSFSRKVMRCLVPLVAPVVIPAKEKELAILRQSTIKWTSFRPPLITKKGKAHLMVDEQKLHGMTVGVEQLAALMLDSVEHELWVKKAPFVATK